MRDERKKLMKSPLFDRFTEDELETMTGCMGGILRSYQKKDIIILSEEEVSYIGIVVEGTVHLVKENASGDQSLLAVIREGEVFGESFACGNNICSYVTFMAADFCKIFFVPAQKLLHTCKMTCTFHHRLIENMVVMLAKKNVQLMQKIDITSQKTVRDKILTFLKLQKQQKQQEYVDVDMNRTTLADYLGVNRSALARELSQMQEEGILRFQKNRFYL